MAKQPKTYRASERGYVDGRIVEGGEVFTTTAPKGEWMDEAGGKGQPGEKLARAVEEAQDPRNDDPSLESLSKAALNAKALDHGITDPGKLSKKDLITAIKAAYDRDRTQ